MLVFINTINHNVISLLTQVQKQPPTPHTARAPEGLTSQSSSWRTFNKGPQTPSHLAKVTKVMAIIPSR